MTRTQKNKSGKKKHIIMSAIILILFFVGTSYRYSQKSISSMVEAGDVSEGILLMTEKSTINMAFEYEKAAIEAEEARLEHEKKQREIQEKKKLTEQGDAKIAYLTFDDGPSDNITPKILDILKKYDIKATFFVVGSSAERYPELIKKMYEEGHSIGNHSYSHDYKYLYKKVDNFMSELDATNKILKDILGEDFESNIIRFPGGSFGDKRASFRKAVEDKGYTYYDWNSLNGDAEGKNISKNRLVQRFKNTSRDKKELIVLMHDMWAKDTTVEALPEIIEYLQQNDYKFNVLE